MTKFRNTANSPSTETLIYYNNVFKLDAYQSTIG